MADFVEERVAVFRLTAADQLQGRV